METGTQITELRSQLDSVLAQLATDRAALIEREREVAAAAEQLSQETSVQAAWQHGCRYERDRVAALIDHQLDQLQRGGMNATVLQALRRMVLEVEP
jgi:hypothetical protein